MASTIHPVSPTTGQMIFEMPFTKADGSPGEIESGSLSVELSDPAVGTLVLDAAAVPATVKVQHNGGAGTVMMNGSADGNLLAGPENEARFVFSEEITFLPPTGATAGGFVPGTETGIS